MQSASTRSFVALETDVLRSSKKLGEPLLDALDSNKDVMMLGNGAGFMIKDTTVESAKKNIKDI